MANRVIGKWNQRHLVTETEVTPIIETAIKVEHFISCVILIPFSVLFYSSFNTHNRAVK